jgi:hypothetical protein
MRVQLSTVQLTNSWIIINVLGTARACDRRIRAADDLSLPNHSEAEIAVDHQLRLGDSG